MQEPRKRVVRARQRSRADALVGFNRALPPQLSEWGIDRFTFTLTGDWRAYAGDGHSLFENRFDDPELSWLLRPTGRGYKRSVATRAKSKSPLTLGRLEVVATRCSGQYGSIAIEASVNPTRTLSALLVRFGDQPNFADAIAELPALEFFAKLPSPLSLPPALNDDDNYLPDHPAARRLLPPDAFSRFMPIYLAQLQRLLARAISATPDEADEDGTDQVFRAHEQGEIRVNWATVEVPQVESYFERYHSRAVAAVRRAGASILDTDPRPTLRLYPHEPDFLRAADCYRVSLAVSDERRLIVYAKTPDRIRFEVKRHGRGRYGEIGPGTFTTHRLFGILMLVERTEANRLLDWPAIFEQFDEADAPALGDLVELVSAIARAADGNTEAIRVILEQLIVDGGFSVELHSAVSDEMVTSLLKSGIIKQTELRNRKRQHHRRRYTLTSDYAWLREALVGSLIGAREADLAE